MKVMIFFLSFIGLNALADNVTKDHLSLEVFKFSYNEIPEHAQMLLDSYDKNQDSLFNPQEVKVFRDSFSNISKKIFEEGSSSSQLIEYYAQNKKVDPIEIKWAFAQYFPEYIQFKLNKSINKKLLDQTLSLINSGEYSVHNASSLNSFDLLVKDTSFYGKLEKQHQFLLNFNELLDLYPAKKSLLKVLEFFNEYKVFPYFKGDKNILTYFLHQISKMSLGPKGLYRYYLLENIAVTLKNNQFVFHQPQSQKSFILKHPSSYRINSISFLKNAKKRLKMALTSKNSENLLNYLMKSNDIFSRPHLLGPVIQDLSRELIFYLDLDNDIQIVFDDNPKTYLSGKRAYADFENNVVWISSTGLEEHFSVFGHEQTLEHTLYLLMQELIHFKQKDSVIYSDNFETYNSLTYTNLVFGTFGNFYYSDQPLEIDAHLLAKEVSESLFTKEI